MQYDTWMKSDPNYKEVQRPSSAAKWDESLSAAREVFYAEEAKNPISGATHYYSPKAQAQLHRVNPKMFPSTPSFITDEAILVPNPPGVSEDAFRFYKNIR
ncbi:cell wall hydrolase [Paludibacterium purpuratum]|uniref:cell wall hydrolase n=1 Tax=Paludibacterium purpuratum TaxID=1144873 RepID=UPI001061553D